MADTSTVLIDPYLEHLWDRRGTDVLFTAGAPPLFRVDGAFGPAQDWGTLSSEDVERIVLSVLPPDLHDEFHKEKDADFSFSWERKARFRASAFIQRGSYALSLRLIPFKIPSFHDLGIPPIVEKLVQVPRGLVLATGATGMGKSTTLASIIDLINRNRACHIVTVEDPIEYVHQHNLAAVNQREVGQDATSFQRALRSALRSDPAVLLIGEMRDLETIQTALSMAETGHLVFATLHTNDTAQAIDR